RSDRDWSSDVCSSDLRPRVLGYLQDAFWRFTADADRRKLAPEVERVLRAGLDAASTSSLKGAYFAALRNVALTTPTLEWLTSIRSEERRVGEEWRSLW